MEDLNLMGTESGLTTATPGTCDECGRTGPLTARVDPESPLSDTRHLCVSCAHEPEPFWDDER